MSAYIRCSSSEDILTDVATFFAHKKERIHKWLGGEEREEQYADRAIVLAVREVGDESG